MIKRFIGVCSSDLSLKATGMAGEYELVIATPGTTKRNAGLTLTFLFDASGSMQPMELTLNEIIRSLLPTIQGKLGEDDSLRVIVKSFNTEEAELYNLTLGKSTTYEEKRIIPDGGTDLSLVIDHLASQKEISSAVFAVTDGQHVRDIENLERSFRTFADTKKNGYLPNAYLCKLGNQTGGDESVFNQASAILSKECKQLNNAQDFMSYLNDCLGPMMIATKVFVFGGVPFTVKIEVPDLVETGKIVKPGDVITSGGVGVAIVDGNAEVERLKAIEAKSALAPKPETAPVGPLDARGYAKKRFDRAIKLKEKIERFYLVDQSEETRVQHEKIAAVCAKLRPLMALDDAAMSERAKEFKALFDEITNVNTWKSKQNRANKRSA